MKNLIQLTAIFMPSEGKYKPTKHSIHERIEHRASEMARFKCHINSVCGSRKQMTQEERQNDYEVRCLEKGKRPFNYPDNLWEEYLREFASEEHTNRNEAKNAWRYEH